MVAQRQLMFVSLVVPPPLDALNDDDLYLIDLRTRNVIQEFGCSSATAQSARIGGLVVKPGQALLKGMQARSLGLLQ